MDSKYIHLIALIVAVFFSGIYLRGEGARKKEIKRELKAIEMRQAEINDLVDEINTTAAIKDSLLNLKIAFAKDEIRILNRGDSLARDSIDVLGAEIIAVNNKLNQLAQQINNVPRFIVEEPDLHSAFVDPDASVLAEVEFEQIQTFVGQPLLEATAIAIEEAPAAPAHLTIAEGFADDPTTEALEGGVVEDPNNRSPEIDGWLSALLAEPFNSDGTGAPYCAAFTSFCLQQAGNVRTPQTRSARARHFVKKGEFEADMCAKSLALNRAECNVDVPARVVIRGVAAHIQPGTMVIWKSKKNPDDTSGHIGFVREWEGHKGKTVEGNTSSGIRGSQSDGTGVYFRERLLEMGNWFRITNFRPVVLK
ncbi:MAG: hypothetical protein AB8G77_11815 [Rhodothermales bacterium]